MRLVSAASAAGPSPRWRGDRMTGVPEATRHGTIPALAGRPSIRPRASARRWDHPRAGGETHKPAPGSDPRQGPSPRWRGDRRVICSIWRRSRTIPALAGRPEPCPYRTSAASDHPRAGGETFFAGSRDHRRRGPSPRWRGDLPRAASARCRRRTIPALAGRPRASPGPRGATADHPRAGGETLHGLGGLLGRQGPSPRWRGDPRRPGQPLEALRTIPALAGRPPAPPPAGRSSRDHPRAGGETSTRENLTAWLFGPSPRWRGDHRGVCWPLSVSGTIPALAGRPRCPEREGSAARDHPRAGGETERWTIGYIAESGPSPRWRGDRPPQDPPCRRLRTIPALAGRPRAPGGRPRIRWDHPRAGGETSCV